MENFGNQISNQDSKHPRKDLLQTEPKRDINEYAERYRLAYDALSSEILDLERKLERASEERMDPLKAKGGLKETYTEIMGLLQAEIARKKLERDNLHTQKTIH